jgi:pimeloyl-ACP methyl ester carboxylesterase
MGPSQTLRLRDGRRLGWTTYGAEDGLPVLAFHGAPACRLMFVPADGPAQRLGLHLIAPDRPGYGLSDAKPGRTLGGWADDVAQLMDHLGIDRAAIVAISGGGPYAVATAAQLGPRITGLALVSPLGEVGAEWAQASMTRAQRAFFAGFPRHPRLLRRSAVVGRAAFLAAPGLAYATFRALLAEADRRVLAAPEARRVVIDMTREALCLGVEGAVSDMAIYGRPWSEDLGSIRCPSALWQGTADHIVPAEAAFDLGRRLPGASCIASRAKGTSGCSST